LLQEEPLVWQQEPQALPLELQAFELVAVSV
jgi:hypothetical protein